MGKLDLTGVPTIARGERTMAEAFDEWMRAYVEEPERFSSRWAEIRAHLLEIQNGEEPSYGRSCAAMLEKLMRGEETFLDCVAPPSVKAAP